ncbi:MAG TPA: Npt1/Npt2 family nucleotide transporter, partial [Candidatus Azoamicus sp.]
MSDVKQQEEFGRWRKLLWPIHNHELKKFLPLGFIMFGILFNYT